MFPQEKINILVKELADRYEMPTAKIAAIVRSQFEVAREGTEKKLNTRFPYLGLFYNRDNKNPDYLKMKENEKRREEHRGL